MGKWDNQLWQVGQDEFACGQAMLLLVVWLGEFDCTKAISAKARKTPWSVLKL